MSQDELVAHLTKHHSAVYNNLTRLLHKKVPLPFILRAIRENWRLLDNDPELLFDNLMHLVKVVSPVPPDEAKRILKLKTRDYKDRIHVPDVAAEPTRGAVSTHGRLGAGAGIKN